MIAPRWKKAWRDTVSRPGRSVLAIVAMAAGVFALGTMVFKYTILRPVLSNMYGITRPSAATLVTDRIDDELLESVRRIPGVGDAESRPVVVARARVGEEWVPAILYVVRDFDHQRMDYFKPTKGAWPPADGDLLIERSALPVAKIKLGESLTLRTASGEDRAVPVTGSVYAGGLAPAWMEHVVYGFVSWSSRLRGEENGESAQLRIRVQEHELDEGHIREVATRVEQHLEAAGHPVSRVDVPIPGRHPHADQMDTFLYLVGAFGILSFVLSAVLVASMIHALLTEQVRQVGIMKALGAQTYQIAGIYLGQIALLAIGALAIGAPLALNVGRAYAEMSAGILNADVTRSPFPLWALASLIVVGILVPMLVALVPVLRASRITVHQALNDDLGPRPFGSHGFERALTKLSWLPRPLILSLRSTFIRRGRLALTIGMLAIGGAVFMSALNVGEAWNRSVIRDFSLRRYDLTVRLASAQPVTVLAESLATLPSVVRAEYWSGASPYLVGENGAAGSRVSLLGLDPESELLALRVREGRWLRAGDTTGAVINSGILQRNPALRVGGTVEMHLDGEPIALPIVGVVHELTPAPAIYAPKRFVLAVTGESGETARTIRVVTRDHTEEGQLAAAQEIEGLFERMQIEVTALQRMLDARKGILDHLVIVMAILTMASMIVVFVGGLALTSTLTINVLQRTREIGILGSLGATPRTIASHVWFEGVVIATLSWVVANVLAAPISAVLEAVTGRMFLRTPIEFYMSPNAAAIWLGFVLVLASLSSFYPAWRASRLTVREAISYS